MNGMVRREGYLEQLHASKGATGVIKVITGMRRCGKTTLMEQFEDDLRSEGVDDEHIFHVNFESFEGYDMLAPDDLRRELKALPGTVRPTSCWMRYMVLGGSNTDDMSRPLENAVYLELIRRGYTVRTGSYRDREVDFTAVKGNLVEYYQVAMTMMSDDTRRREFRSLESMKDNYPKTILTMDRFNLGNYDGIMVVNVIEWMIGR